MFFLFYDKKYHGTRKFNPNESPDRKPETLYLLVFTFMLEYSFLLYYVGLDGLTFTLALIIIAQRLRKWHAAA